MTNPSELAATVVPAVRHVLVVDDQRQIHESFDRIFLPREHEDDVLADFESRFLGRTRASEAEPESVPRHEPPRYELAHAYSGEQAAEMVERSIVRDHRFSVAFVDMRMPRGWDGLETTDRLWRIDPALQVVICTAHSDHLWDDVLDRLGHNDRLLLIKKPFESDEIRQLALALSEKSRLATEQQRKMSELKREVEQRQRVEANLREIALRDTLTQLPNRTFLLHRLQSVVDRRRRDDAFHDALLFLDLDNFKIINDSLGHEAGDDLLRQVAGRLQECVRQHDMTTRCQRSGEERTVRLGGDEFVVLLEQLSDPKDALAIARRIVDRLEESFDLGDRLVNVGTSVGVAFLDQYVTDGAEALRNADTAMYRAKQSGKGRIAIFDQTMHEDVCARLELEEKLRQAVARKAFTLRYQPIVDLRTGRVRGVEVLIRWRGTDGTYVPPDDFIPVIEEIGLIGEVGEWVIEKATSDFGQLLRGSPADADRQIYAGVNVSKRQLGDPYFTERLDSILERTQFDRRLLKLEMIESADPRQGEQVLNTMLELQDSGVGIHIDDFGKGQSSLTCFQAYPIETVKIDRSFTASIACNHSHSVITQAIVQLAHHLSAKIVAEGVESEQQLQALRAWGCDLAQGYLFSPPLELDELRAFLAEPEASTGVRVLRRLASVSGVSAPPPAAGTIRLFD